MNVPLRESDEAVLADSEAVALPVGVLTLLGVLGADAVCVRAAKVALGDAVSVPVRVAAASPVGELVADAVAGGAGVIVGVADAVDVEEGVGVPVRLRVPDAVPDGVLDGVLDGVMDGDGDVDRSIRPRAVMLAAIDGTSHKTPARTPDA